MGKILENISVPKQSNLAGCWAVTASALANAAGKGPQTEQTLVQKYQGQLNPSGSFSVRKALQGLGIDCDDLAVKSACFDAVIEATQRSIDNSKPVVVGFKMANDSLRWKDGKPFTMGHALVCFGYRKEGGGQLFFKDPARLGDNRLILNKNQLQHGFLYMNVSELGPQTRDKLLVNAGHSAIMMKMDRAVIMR